MKQDVTSLYIVSNYTSWIHNAHEKAVDFDCGNKELNDYILSETAPEKNMHSNTITIADIDDNLAGYISYTVSKITPASSFINEDGGYPYLIIEFFGVDKKYKGNGVGRQLMVEVIKVASKIYELVNIHGIYLTAVKSAVDYYQDKFGFEVMNKFLFASPDPNTVIPMRLDILAIMDIAFVVGD